MLTIIEELEQNKTSHQDRITKIADELRPDITKLEELPYTLESYIAILFFESLKESHNWTLTCANAFIQAGATYDLVIKALERI